VRWFVEGLLRIEQGIVHQVRGEPQLLAWLQVPRAQQAHG
jgi:hypothetical protein